MSAVWLTIGGLAVATVLIKGAGPVAMGGRELSPVALRVITLLAPTLLAALVMVQTFGSEDRGLVVDARVLGLLAGGAAIALRAPLAVIVVAAAATAAGARALGAA
jgi:branched-subunit amino acid transport protein